MLCVGLSFSNAPSGSRIMKNSLPTPARPSSRKTRSRNSTAGKPSSAQRALAMLGCILWIGIASPASSRALQITQSLLSPGRLLILGTITNRVTPSPFGPPVNAPPSATSMKCGTDAFVLFGNGRQYQGVASCDKALLGSGETTSFRIVFPHVRPGAYHLRFLKSSSPLPQYEMVPVRLQLRSSP